MTLLGKVFTLSTLVLSVVFFIMAMLLNATHIDNRKKAEQFQAAAQAAELKNSQLTKVLEDTKTEFAIEQAARRFALASLQTQLSQSQAELEMQEATLADLRSQHTTLVQTEQATTQELSAKTQDNETLRKNIVDARQDRDQLLQRLAAATDNMNRLQGDFKSLQTREKQLASDYTAARENLSILGIEPGTNLDAPPLVNGKVTAVATNGLVELNLGRDDGLREGYTLEVHRDGQYLGRVKVRTVRDNKSVAEILTSYQKGYIRSGDRVDSKLF